MTAVGVDRLQQDSGSGSTVSLNIADERRTVEVCKGANGKFYQLRIWHKTTSQCHLRMADTQAWHGCFCGMSGREILLRGWLGWGEIWFHGIGLDVRLPMGAQFVRCNMPINGRRRSCAA
jgi:hypothetical protein